MILNSNRLILQEITLNDMDEIHQLHLHPEVDEFNTMGIPVNIEETRNNFQPFLEDQKKKPQKSFVWKIVLKENNFFVGIAGLKLSRDKFRLGEIFYKFSPNYWGMGYATEVSQRIIKSGFEDFKLHKVEAGVATKNMQSIKVLEKAGMKREGLRRKMLPIRGQWVDCYHYAIVEDDPRNY